MGRQGWGITGLVGGLVLMTVNGLGGLTGAISVSAGRVLFAVAIVLVLLGALAAFLPRG